MKNLKMILGTTLITAFLFSCGNDKVNQVEKQISSFESFVDSVQNLALDNAVTAWDSIEKKAENLKIDTEELIENNKVEAKIKERVAAVSTQYENYKNSILLAKSELSKDNLRKMLFPLHTGEFDSKFTWVTTSNIVQVYDDFVTIVQKNQDSFTEEDWLEIKALYEGLDTRKNSLEKEGLAAKDNLKIGGLKLKFSSINAIKKIENKIENM